MFKKRMYLVASIDDWNYGAIGIKEFGQAEWENCDHFPPLIELASFDVKIELSPEVSKYLTDMQDLKDKHSQERLKKYIEHLKAVKKAHYGELTICLPSDIEN